MAYDPYVHCWYIVRVYQNPEKNDRVTQRGLTEAEGIMWQALPESSSRTATNPAAVAHTEEHGEWMDFRARTPER